MNSVVPVPITAANLDDSYVGRRVYSELEPKIPLDGTLLSVREVETSKKNVKQTVLTIEVTLDQDAYLVLAADDQV